MAIGVSNGFDAGKDNIETKKTHYSYENESFSFKAETSAKISATASESCKINNAYSFNLSMASFAVNAAVKDSTSIGASWCVSCGLPTFDCISNVVSNPDLQSKLKQISSKSCLTYKFFDTVHHRGESLSLRTRKSEERTIDDFRYGTQNITFVGCKEIDIKASANESLNAKASMKGIMAAISAMASAQVASLATGCFAKKGNFGDAGFRGNVSDVKGSSAAISGSAAFVAIMPMIPLMCAGKDSPAYDENNLKGPNGCGTPNNKGILLDVCEPAAGGNFVAKGAGIELNIVKRSQVKSSLKFDSQGMIEMKAKQCSLETDENGGQAGVMLKDKEFVSKAFAGEAKSSLTIQEASMKLRHNKHEIVLIRDAVLADSMSITEGGVSMPGMTISKTGVVNVLA